MLSEIMEIKEEQQLMVGLSNKNYDATHIIAKGKRTKRLRLVTSTCSSVNSGDSSSTTTYESADQEDEDMANCLILLAQGGGGGEGEDSHHHHQKQNDGNDHNKTEEKGSRKFAEMATASTKVGFFIYGCKTCNRTFPSFQALGGHRASHKKPKLMMSEQKKLTPMQSQPQQLQPLPQQQQRVIIVNYDRIEEPHIKTIQLDRGFHGANKTTKIHECSICGSEFTSGQALGGHMRRHRATAAAAPAVQVEVQPRNVLELDLNLPAPEEDLRESNFQFMATQKSMVLSAAPALVDCHY